MGFKCECYASVFEKDPRAKIWENCLGKAEFPLKHPLPGIINVNLKDQDPYVMRVYMGDPDRLTDDQKEKLIEHIQTTFGVPRDQIVSDWSKEGIPIKAENLTISWCHSHSLAAL